MGTLMGSLMGTWIRSSTGKQQELRWERGNMEKGDEAQAMASGKGVRQKGMKRENMR